MGAYRLEIRLFPTGDLKTHPKRTCRGCYHFSASNSGPYDEPDDGGLYRSPQSLRHLSPPPIGRTARSHCSSRTIPELGTLRGSVRAFAVSGVRRRRVSTAGSG